MNPVQSLAGATVMVGILWVGGCEAKQPAISGDDLPQPPSGLTDDELVAFVTLADCDRMEALVVGPGASHSWKAQAFRRILDSPNADRVFKALLREGTPAARLYAVCGLYWTDQRAFGAQVKALRSCPDPVEFQEGCIVMARKIADLVDSPDANAVRLRPGHRWRTAGKDTPISRMDISGGGLPNCYAEGTQRWANASEAYCHFGEQGG